MTKILLTGGGSGGHIYPLLAVAENLKKTAEDIELFYLGPANPLNDEFKKLDIRIGKIIGAEKVEDSDKLLQLQVSFGSEERRIIAGIGDYYKPEEIIGKLCPFIFNLETKIIKGLESQGMILCADSNGPVLLNPDKDLPPGSAVR